MHFKTTHEPWTEIVLVDATARTVTLSDGSVRYLARDRRDLIELDVFITDRIEKYAPWEVKGDKLLVLTSGEEILDYEIRLEVGDEAKHELFYFNRFSEDESEYFRFPDYLMEGVCVRVDSVAVRYFLADTLFFDYLLSGSSPEVNKQEIIGKLTDMKKTWLKMKRSQQG